MEYLNLNSFETKRSVTIDSLKTHFLPIQEGEGDPSPDNIRPITGWNSIKIRKCGKNLAKVFGFDTSTIRSVSQTRRKTNTWGTTISETNYADELVITQDGYNNSSNVRHYSNGYFVIGLDALSFDKRYNVSFKITNIVSNPLNASLSDIRISNPYGNYYSDPVVTEDGKVSFNNYLYKKNMNEPGRCGIEVYNCGMSFTISEFMITAVEDEDFTYEPYREEEIEAELPETMYGGYVDITKGELVQEYTAISAKLSDCTRKVTYEENDPNSGMVWYDFQPFVDFGITNNNKQMSTICKYSYNLADRKINHFYMYTMQPSGRTRLLLFLTEEDDQPEDFEFTVVGQLVTPIHYPIPPETLKTLRGFNTIFSTGNDSIEVGYSELSPMSLLELRRSIIASEPHLVTVETGNTEDSDVIASFKTNTALPIKSMITNFEPKQEGEGDPTPENIRPITGLNKLTVKRCGKNLFDEQTTIIYSRTTSTNGWAPSDTAKSVAIKVSPSTTYTISYNNAPDNNIIFRGGTIEVDPSTVGDSRIQFTQYIIPSKSTDNYFTVTTGKQDMWIVIQANSNVLSERNAKIQVELGSQSTAYELYKEEVVEIELPETMYGGYVDIAKGEVVQEYKLITITGSESNAIFNWNAYAFTSPGLVSSNSVWAVKACSHTSNLLSGSGMHSSRDSGFDNAVCVSATPLVRYRDRNNFNDLETAKTYLQGQYANGTPVQIVAQLETPIHYSISSETIKTLKGMNNIYTNANGKSIIKYWTH